LRKGGWYDDLLVVDHTGLALRVKGAEKLHGVGLFRGYNIFLNQRIKMKLHVAGPRIQVSLEEVKDKIFESFRISHGWATRADYQELKANVRNASSIAEIIERLSPCKGVTH
jgi:hypothetical protein